MSEAITQPVYEPQAPQAPVSSMKFIYAGVAVGAVALGLGGAALGVSLAQPHVSPAQVRAYANSAASNAETQAVAQANSNTSAALPQMGVCFHYNTQSGTNYYDNSSTTWVTDVEVTTPTNTNGVLRSCSTGTFVSLTPTAPAHN